MNTLSPTALTVIHNDRFGDGEPRKYPVTLNLPDAHIGEKLEKIWRAMNVVDGTDDELPLKMGIRSMMVGDEVELDGITYRVAMCGWFNVDTQKPVDY